MSPDDDGGGPVVSSQGGSQYEDAVERQDAGSEADDEAEVSNALQVGPHNAAYLSVHGRSQILLEHNSRTWRKCNGCLTGPVQWAVGCICMVRIVDVMDVQSIGPSQL